ncbi:MAG: hypothetical protein FJX36_08460 [Alphaproteobacteria bacterium]|nr:hypothetical protein [Alphaproteobacteria bacterium]
MANAAYRAIAVPPGVSIGPLEAPNVVVRVVREGRSVEHTYRAGPPDAERTFVAVHSPLKDEHGTIVAVGGHYREITGQARAERRLDVLGERLDDINRLLSDWVWEVDASFRIQMLSPRASDALGQPVAALVGANLLDIGAFARPAGRVPGPASRSPFSDQEFHSVDIGGETRYNRMTGVPVFDATGTFCGYRGVGTDITARVRAGSRAAHAQMLLVEAIEAPSEVFALFDAQDRLVLSNQRFRELHPALANLARPGVPQYLEYVRNIHESGRHLLNLINDILDFSKAEAGKLTLHESEISLPALIARCRRFVEEMALAGGVALAEGVPTTIPGLRADERKVKQMLLNLLSNAVKFTPGGGTVTTRVRVDPDGALILAVIETGKGMTRDEIPKALSPFVQLEDALTRRHQGTRLGLPLTRSLIELHGGAIKVESAVGIGTTVSLHFPAERVWQMSNIVAPSLTKGGAR